MKTVVIGGGIIGLCTAFYLSESDFDVYLLEKDTIASKASYGNAGSMWPSLPSRTSSDLISKLGTESLRQFDRLSHVFSFDYERNGVIEPLFSKASFENSKTVIQEATRRNRDIQFLSRDETILKEPTINGQIEGSLYCRTDAKASSFKLSLAIAKRIKSNNSQILENCKCLGANIVEGRIKSLNTTKGEVKADYVINAAGPWSKWIKGSVDIPVKPAKGYSVTAKPSEPIKHSVWSNEIEITMHEKYMRASGIVEMSEDNSLRMGRNNWPLMWQRLQKDEKFDDSIDEEKIAHIVSTLEKTFPSTTFDITEKWAGIRPYTPDRLPVIGKDPRISNFIIATGHFKDGFHLAPVTGILVKEIIEGIKPSIDISSLSPSRFTNIQSKGSAL